MKSPKIAETIAHKLESMILEGTLKPGEKLPPERQLAESLGVSRPSLREAIQIMATKRLLKTRQGGGTYVGESLAPSLTDPLLEIFRERPETRYDLLEVRHALEGLSAYYAALRRTDADIMNIQECFNRMLDLHGKSDPIAEARADTEFHLAIAQAADNVVLLHLMRGLFVLLRDSISFNLDRLYINPGVYDLLKQQHRALLSAVVDGKPDQARQATHDHLAFVGETLKRIDKEEARKARALRRLTPFVL